MCLDIVLYIIDKLVGSSDHLLVPLNTLLTNTMYTINKTSSLLFPLSIGQGHHSGVNHSQCLCASLDK